MIELNGACFTIPVSSAAQVHSSSVGYLLVFRAVYLLVRERPYSIRLSAEDGALLTAAIRCRDYLDVGDHTLAACRPSVSS